MWCGAREEFWRADSHACLHLGGHILRRKLFPHLPTNPYVTLSPHPARTKDGFALPLRAPYAFVPYLGKACPLP